MANTYTLIASNTLSSSAASVTFSAIPNTYTDLVLRVSSRNNDTGTSEGFLTQFNSDTSTNYSWRALLVGGGAPGSQGYSNQADIENRQAGNGATSNTFSSMEIYIPSYTASQNKPVSSYYVIEKNVTDAYIGVEAGLWRNTAAISSIKLFNNGSIVFASGSSFFLYGIKNS